MKKTATTGKCCDNYRKKNVFLEKKVGRKMERFFERDEYFQYFFQMKAMIRGITIIKNIIKALKATFNILQISIIFSK